MKAISLHQPWATAIAMGFKTIETRSWATTHRGPLAIHASKNMKFVRKEADAIFQKYGKDVPPVKYWHPGCIICVVDVFACHRTEDMRGVGLSNLAFGDFSPGRFGWILEKVRPLQTPVPVRGFQGLWTIPDDVMVCVQRQLDLLQ